MECYADLHIHTNNSDGLLNSVDCLLLAIKTGVEVVSFTDHDSVGAYKSFDIYKNEIRIVPGIELTVNNHLHILGYYIDVKSIDLNKELNKMKAKKAKWLFKLVDYLSTDYEVTIKSILKNYSEITVGSICQALIMATNGKLNKKDIYDMFFWDKSGDFPLGALPSFTVEEAIKLIKDSGGIAFLAHPALVWENDIKFQGLLNELICYGLDGLEVYHISNERQGLIPYLEKEAIKRRLAISGGSDFHGKKNKQTNIGDFGLSKEDFQNFELLS